MPNTDLKNQDDPCHKGPNKAPRIVRNPPCPRRPQKRGPKPQKPWNTTEKAAETEKLSYKSTVGPSYLRPSQKPLNQQPNLLPALEGTGRSQCRLQMRWSWAFRNLRVLGLARRPILVFRGLGRLGRLESLGAFEAPWASQRLRNPFPSNPYPHSCQQTY